MREFLKYAIREKYRQLEYRIADAMLKERGYAK